MTTSWAIFTGFAVVLSVVAIIAANGLPPCPPARRKIGKVRAKTLKISTKVCADGLCKRR